MQRFLVIRHPSNVGRHLGYDAFHGIVRGTADVGRGQHIQAEDRIVRIRWLFPENIQAGAGVVADSLPELEWKETMNKGRAVFRAVAMAEAGIERYPCVVE